MKRLILSLAILAGFGALGASSAEAGCYDGFCGPSIEYVEDCDYGYEAPVYEHYDVVEPCEEYGIVESYDYDYGYETVESCDVGYGGWW